MERNIKDRTELEKKFWNSKARSYDQVVNKFFPKIYEIVIENLIKDTGQSQKLLEVATGTGILAIQLSSHVSHITAVDISPEMLQVAKEKVSKDQINNIDFRIGDVCNLEFADKSFDTIVASNVLHLLFQPELALQEIRRVLFDNGRIIIPTFCHAANLKSIILSKFLSLLGQKTKNRWNQKSLIAFVENNGFKITKNVYISDKIPLLYLVGIKG
jgi:ubiquinone/menaquinone biosynthesis C-methylase UbiE